MSTITIPYHQNSERRQPFARAIAEILGIRPRYTGVPKCAYVVDFVTVNRDGNLEVDDQVDTLVIARLVQKLTELGYTCEQNIFDLLGGQRNAESVQAMEPVEQEIEQPCAERVSVQPRADVVAEQTDEETYMHATEMTDWQSGEAEAEQNTEYSVASPVEQTAETTASGQDEVLSVASDAYNEEQSEVSETDNGEQEMSDDEEVGTTISVPRNVFTDIGLDNLRKILWAKNELICQALDIPNTDIEVTDEAVSFPWFGELDAEEVKYISQFISGLCEFANISKRITSKQKRQDNPKFAMRTWAIRLGFNGVEHKGLRKFLMRRLPGDAAWRYGKPDDGPTMEPGASVSVQVMAQ